MPPSPRVALVTTWSVRVHYQVTVDNRSAQSSTIPLTTPQVLAYLASNGVTNPGYRGFNYFTNAGTVRSQGIDIVTTYRADLGDAGTLNTTLSADYHKNKVTKVEPNPAIFDSLGVNFQRLNRNAIKELMADVAPRLASQQADLGRTLRRGQLGGWCDSDPLQQRHQQRLDQLPL